MKSRINRISMVIVAVLVGVLATGAIAQTEAEIKAQMKQDKTGSNPLNFSFDARLYNEYQWLNGDGHRNLTTIEYRAPLGESWQFRGKARFVDYSSNLNDHNPATAESESGWGDTDLRFMTLPYLSKMAVATGLEIFLDTAQDKTLGTGATSLAPFVFLGFFNTFGKKSMFVPGYQHVFSIDEDDGRDDVHSGLIDLFCLKQSSSGRSWGYVDPQIILDYEHHLEYMLLEIQMGTMIGSGGQSLYAMPSFGIGAERAYDFSLELAWKVVW